MELNVQNLGMGYLGVGRLIGYDSYEKDGVTKHIYSVLKGQGMSNGLYERCELITIIQDKDTIPEKKCQDVLFTVETKKFNNEQYNAYSNVRPLK